MHKLTIIKKEIATGDVLSNETSEYFSIYNAQKQVNNIQLQFEYECEELKLQNSRIYYANKKRKEDDKLPKLKQEIETIIKLNGVIQ